MSVKIKNVISVEVAAFQIGAQEISAVTALRQSQC
jgi:hypothetical protein